MDPLLAEENLIDKRWFVINPDAPESFFNTMIAMYRIMDKKLYKSQFSNLQDYLAPRWNLSESQGRNFGRAGRVLTFLQEAGIERDDLPPNVSLLLAVKKVSEKEGRTYAETWTKAVKYFSGRCNVVASDMEKAFKEDPLPPPPKVTLTKTAAAPATPPSSATPSPTCPVPSSTYSLRPRRVRVEAPSSNDQGEHVNLRPLKVRRKHIAPSTESEYNTPAWLYAKIKVFAGPNGIDLDPCWNPESLVEATQCYGIQRDGSFIDALQLEDWHKSDLVYVNSPSQHVLFWERIQLELDKGNIQRVIALSPLRPYTAWCGHLLANAMVGMLKKKVLFDKTKAAQQRNAGSTCGAIFSRFVVYVDRDETYPMASKFVEVFQDVAFIPNVNMRDHRVVEVACKSTQTGV
ncbi:hypothetical protein BC832DRAFT_595886 [Gaertneriomyces semiglobifer]|nr:hypothetical protein BC832DRAFT_595886 [Gaertneriomyces semiglobifer]